MNTILQVPINKNLRDQAVLNAEKMGFSSLQEMVRLFINKIAAGEMEVKFQPVIQLEEFQTIPLDQLKKNLAQTGKYSEKFIDSVIKGFEKSSIYE